MKIFIVLAFWVLGSNAFPLKEIVIDYDNGYSYKVTYDNDKLTWTGLKGDDAGKSQSNTFSYHKVCDHEYIVRWIEEGSIVVHSKFDLKNKTVVSSIFVPEEDESKRYFYPFLIGKYKEY